MRDLWRIAILLLGVTVLCSACGVTPSVAPSAAPPIATMASAPAHPVLTLHPATARIQTGAPTSLSVSCRPGEQMLGGGFAATNLFEFAAYVEASYPSSATTWTVIASAPASYFDLKADVYCAQAAPMDIQVVHASGASFMTAACPQGTVLLGGGFQSSQPIGVSHPQGNGWLVAGSAGWSGSVQAYSLCAARHVLLGNAVTATFNPHSSTHNYAPSSRDVACPAGQIAVGGGFESSNLVLGSQTRGLSFSGWSIAAGGDADVMIAAVCVLLQA